MNPTYSCCLLRRILVLDVSLMTSSPPDKKRKTDRLVPLGNAATSCGVEAFEWLISPINAETFIDEYWEQQPLHVNRSSSQDYFQGLVPLETARKKSGQAGDQIVIESAETKFSWLHALVERLENFSGCVWQARYEYHSKGSDEFSEVAFNDSETFVLVLSGSSDWRVAERDEVLSVEATSETPSLWQFDSSLGSGDVLYFPRGSLYQMNSSAETAFVILSTSKRESWGDLLSLALPQTLHRLVETEVAFRKGVPFGWRSKFGRFINGYKCMDEDAVSGNESESARAEIVQELRDLVHAIAESIDLDDLADQLASEFIACRTPPAPRKGAEGPQFGPDPKLHAAASIRFRNPAWVRVIEAEGIEGEEQEFTTLIVSSVANKLDAHAIEGEEPVSLEIAGLDKQAAFAELFATWPKFIGPAALGQAAVVALWEAGIIETHLEK